VHPIESRAARGVAEEAGVTERRGSPRKGGAWRRKLFDISCPGEGREGEWWGKHSSRVGPGKGRGGGRTRFSFVKDLYIERAGAPRLTWASFEPCRASEGLVMAL